MGAFAVGIRLWKNGLIPYVLDKKHPFYKEIMNAITEVNNKTILNMHERNENELDYIEFVYYPDKCNYSSLGMTGGRQEINIKHSVRVLHEIGHAIGLIHEHQRPDRDEHIKIFRENVSDSHAQFFQESFFDKSNHVAFCTFYDVKSCMHYWSTIGGKDKAFMDRLKSGFKGEGLHKNLKTWEPINCDSEINYETPEVFSDYDVHCINEYYKSNEKITI